jgi:hypothetical protein
MSMGSTSGQHQGDASGASSGLSINLAFGVPCALNRSMLDTPKKLYTPGARLDAAPFEPYPSSHAPASASRAHYGVALNNAEVCPAT